MRLRPSSLFGGGAVDIFVVLGDADSRNHMKIP
jgi:hypothetical protein